MESPFQEAKREFRRQFKDLRTLAYSQLTVADRIRAIAATPADFALADDTEAQGHAWLRILDGLEGPDGPEPAA